MPLLAAVEAGAAAAVRRCRRRDGSGVCRCLVSLVLELKISLRDVARRERRQAHRVWRAVIIRLLFNRSCKPSLTLQSARPNTRHRHRVVDGVQCLDVASY